MYQPPWTSIGALQQTVDSLKGQLHGKADDHEIHSLRSRVDGLERTIREVRTEIAGLQSKMQELETVAVGGAR